MLKEYREDFGAWFEVSSGVLFVDRYTYLFILQIIEYMKVTDNLILVTVHLHGGRLRKRECKQSLLLERAVSRTVEEREVRELIN